MCQIDGDGGNNVRVFRGPLHVNVGLSFRSDDGREGIVSISRAGEKGGWLEEHVRADRVNADTLPGVDHGQLARHGENGTLTLIVGRRARIHNSTFGLLTSLRFAGGLGCVRSNSRRRCSFLALVLSSTLAWIETTEAPPATFRATRKERVQLSMPTTSLRRRTGAGNGQWWALGQR